MESIIIQVFMGLDPDDRPAFLKSIRELCDTLETADNENPDDIMHLLNQET